MDSRVLVEVQPVSVAGEVEVSRGLCRQPIDDGTTWCPGEPRVGKFRRGPRGFRVLGCE